MKNLTYNISTKVFFGDKTIENLGIEIEKYSKNILIVYGSERIKSNGFFSKVSQELKKFNIRYIDFGGIKPNPSLESVQRNFNNERK